METCVDKETENTWCCFLGYLLHCPQFLRYNEITINIKYMNFEFSKNGYNKHKYDKIMLPKMRR